MKCSSCSPESLLQLTRFTHAAPVITVVSPYNMASVSVKTTLAGMSFAPTDVTVTAVLALANCATSAWMAATSVRCTGTRGGGPKGTFGLTAATVVGTSSVVFSFDGDKQFDCFVLPILFVLSADEDHHYKVEDTSHKNVAGYISTTHTHANLSDPRLRYFLFYRTKLQIKHVT